MTDSKSSLPWWPFLAADALFLGLAGLLLQQGHKPLLGWEAALLITCVAAAAGFWMLPFLRRHQDEQSLAQARVLTDALNQIQKIDQVAAQIVGATNQWREFQQKTDEISASSKSLAGAIAAEAKGFSEFLQKASDSEKAHLRLEAEKLRRAETEWLQVVIHILDHVSALNVAARRSGQPAYAEQIGQFHKSCHDIARRIGLGAVTGREGEPFDPNLHQLREKVAPEENTVVGETLVPGYTFQGQLVRRPLVALNQGPKAEAEALRQREIIT
jgi:molecular chaperone GrpE (heat shock protein)